MSHLADRIAKSKAFIESPRFDGIVRLFSARDVAVQQGTIDQDYTVTRQAAEAFYARLETLRAEGKSITTLGPYTPGQAVTMKRAGIEGIYLGGWATSAKGSVTEDPGADLASYPLSQVPDEAAPIVRALLTADRNQYFLRSRMTEAERAETPEIDFRPFIIADADTGHGGDGHVRNLVRRFVEVGVPGYHIEDQRPGTKKCGHQGGKVLVPVDEQIKRLNSARFQLDVMRVPGLIVARTDSEAATLLDNPNDERDHGFILGATNNSVPPYKMVVLAVFRRFHELGIDESRGHLLYSASEEAYQDAFDWLDKAGITPIIEERARNHDPMVGFDATLNPAAGRASDAWAAEARLRTFGEAVSDVMAFRISEGEAFAMTPDEFVAMTRRVSFTTARNAAAELGIRVIWDRDRAKTPEGYVQIRPGIEYAIAKSLAIAPFCDIIWMETKTANLHDAGIFAKAIHEQFPGKMLAYNLSPSFNWDTTGMTDQEMKDFPAGLGKLGYVFNFITYGGHQVDGLAGLQFATALREDGMLALARLQRKLRLLESPYKTPQTLVGGPRLDSALSASTGRTATTKAMGKGSTQFQHLVHTEVPPSVLRGWLGRWNEHNHLTDALSVELRPHTAGEDLLELRVVTGGETVANIVFSDMRDRRGKRFLSVRDQNTFDSQFRQKRLMTIIHLYLIHRYKAHQVHYVSPTEDNEYQTSKMQDHGIFSDVHSEIGQIIVATVNKPRIEELLEDDGVALGKLIDKTGPPSSR